MKKKHLQICTCGHNSALSFHEIKMMYVLADYIRLPTYCFDVIIRKEIITMKDIQTIWNMILKHREYSSDWIHTKMCTSKNPYRCQ